MNFRKNSRGITLIALVITIIVLLILAGVTLSLVTGSDGILGKAKTSADKTKEASAKEQVELKIAEYHQEYYEALYIDNDESVNINTKKGKWITQKYGGEYNEQATEDHKFTITGDRDPYTVTIKKDKTLKADIVGSLDLDGKLSWTISGTGGSTPEVKNQTWTQTGTTVTDGTITLNVGQAVTGYTGNSVGDGNWAVLGAEDGKLLITTKSNQGENITLGNRSDITVSQRDYVQGIITLNTVAEAYKDTNMADIARSMKVEDINRVTGYKPENIGLSHDGGKYGVGNAYEYGKENTYSSGTFYVGRNWVTATSSAPQTVTSNYYYYYPQTLKTTSSSATNIVGQTGTEAAYNLIFTNGDGTKKTYWLASQFVCCYDSYAGFGLRGVYSGRMSTIHLCYSDGDADSNSCGLRPVVALKSEVKVTADGALTM